MSLKAFSGHLKTATGCLWCFVFMIHGLTAKAQEPDLRAVPIMKGQEASFSGMLMTIDLATNLGTKLESCQVTKKLELQYRRKLCTLNNAKFVAVSEIRERALMAKLKATTKALSEVEGRPFWEEPVFVATVGVLGGVALSFGAVWAAGQLAN